MDVVWPGTDFCNTYARRQAGWVLRHLDKQQASGFFSSSFFLHLRTVSFCHPQPTPNISSSAFDHLMANFCKNKVVRNT